MKLLVVILDGIGDEKLEILGVKTPLEYAKTPNLDMLKNQGAFGFVNTEKKGYPVESSSCILNIIGAEEKAFKIGRSYFEAKAKNINLKKDESVVRFNIVTTDKKGSLTSFNAQGFSKNELNGVFENLNKKYKNIHYMSGYKGLVIAKKQDLINSKLSFPPHENIGQDYDKLIKQNLGDNQYLKGLINDINNFISYYNKEDIFYKGYFYSKQNECTVKSFSEIYGNNAGFVGFTEIAVGIAKMMNMDTIIPQKTTGDSDTNLKNKASSVKSLFSKHNLCFVHINGCDEISHRKNPLEKVDFIEKIDREFFGEIVNDNLKILVLGDHITSSKTGMHKKGDVPYITNLPQTKDLTIKQIHETLRKFV